MIIKNSADNKTTSNYENNDGLPIIALFKFNQNKDQKNEMKGMIDRRRSFQRPHCICSSIVQMRQLCQLDDLIDIYPNLWSFTFDPTFINPYMIITLMSIIKVLNTP